MKKMGFMAGFIMLIANTGIACTSETLLQGTLIREHGGYHLQTPTEKLHITGALNKALLVDNVDNKVKIKGVVSDSDVEVQKLYVFNGKEYEVAYDWDQLKATLYDN